MCFNFCVLSDFSFKSVIQIIIIKNLGLFRIMQGQVGYYNQGIIIPVPYWRKLGKIKKKIHAQNRPHNVFFFFVTFYLLPKAFLISKSSLKQSLLNTFINGLVIQFERPKLFQTNVYRLRKYKVVAISPLLLLIIPNFSECEILIR